MKPTGTWATLLLPIQSDDRIDFGRLCEELEIIAAAGVSGVYSNGTAGEFYSQTEEEFDRIQGLMAEVCQRSGLPFQIGASHTSAQTMLDRVRRSCQWKPVGAAGDPARLDAAFERGGDPVPGEGCGSL